MQFQSQLISSSASWLGFQSTRFSWYGFWVNKEVCDTQNNFLFAHGERPWGLLIGSTEVAIVECFSLFFFFHESNFSSLSAAISILLRLYHGDQLNRAFSGVALKMTKHACGSSMPSAWGFHHCGVWGGLVVHNFSLASGEAVYTIFMWNCLTWDIFLL